MIDDRSVQDFQETVWDYYRRNGRHDLPWRQPGADGAFDPYRIMLSEIMLQQTQVSRVIVKYNEFLERFPTLASLAEAELGEVLRMWSGLGYNRRAKFLHQAARCIADELEGQFPLETKELVKLPGIGINTAGAIAAYAFNRPVIFIETNIRTVYIHHFFHDQSEVADKALYPFIDQTLDREHPREWYWALMDYGSFLKRSRGNAGRQSKHYSRQSIFEGSRRQVRGRVLKALHDGPLSEAELSARIADERLAGVLKALVAEGMITFVGNGTYRL